MIVFKTFLKILNKNKWLVIMYTALLIGMSYLSMSGLESSLTFESVKPKINIRDNDNSKISKDFVEYMKENSEFVEVSNYENGLDDAIFYRQVEYYISIPENYFEDLKNGKDVSIEVKSPGMFNSMVAERLSNRYLRLIKTNSGRVQNDDELINIVRLNLKDVVEVSMDSEVDSMGMLKLSSYFNFANYSILASFVFVISMILDSFNSKMIHNRITISSMPYKEHNRYLLLSSLFLAAFLFVVIILGAIPSVGNSLFTLNGLIIIINMFLFMMCGMALAILIGNLVKGKEAISGIANVVSLGSSFLCGSFVAQSYLPQSVLTIAHIFPSYYYIRANDLIGNIEMFNFDSMAPVLINFLIIIGFFILFVVVNNIVLKKKRTS